MGYFACCTNRPGTNGRAVVGVESAFDKQLLEGFNRVANAGLVRSQPSEIRRRPIEGNFGLNVQFSPEHFEKKRRRKSGGIEHVLTEPDPEAFNFAKVQEGEVIGIVDASELRDVPDESAFGFPYEVEEDLPEPIPVTAIACASPLAKAHVLLVPRLEEKLPQALTTELMLYGLNLMSRSKRKDFRLLFNSLLGFASVNHFHWHGMYLDYCNLSTKRLPIEKVDRSVIAGARTEGRVCIELLAESRWYVRGFVLTAGCRKGVEGAVPPPDLEALANLVGKIVQDLQARNIPHNVLIAPFLGERKSRKIEESSLAGVAVKPVSASPEVYIIPRQPEQNLRSTAGFNAAVCEISGMLVAESEQDFDNMNEESCIEMFKKDVSLSGAEFDNLICKVAWLAA